MAEWLRSGLQIRGHRFESGRRLHYQPLTEVQLILMNGLIKKQYIIDIISQIDHPGNSDLAKLFKFRERNGNYFSKK